MTAAVIQLLDDTLTRLQQAVAPTSAAAARVII